MESNWLNHPALQGMNPIKKQIMLDFIKETQGKPMEAGMKSMMRANDKLKAHGLSFTDKESELVTNILLSNMPPEQRVKAEMFMRMMKNQKK